MATHSQQRNRIVWVLGVVLMLLIAAIAWSTLRSTRTTTVQQAQISNIVIERKDQPPLTLNKTAAGWQLTTPVMLPANGNRIEPLMALAHISDDGYATGDVDMQATGLASPLASIILDDVAIAIGRSDITGERRYALADNKVVFVPEWVMSLINGGISAFANLSLFPDGIDTLYVQQGQSRTQVNDIASWQQLSAKQIVLWPVDDLPAPELSLTLHTDPNSALVTAELYLYTEFALMKPASNFAYVVSKPDIAPLLAAVITAE